MASMDFNIEGGIATLCFNRPPVLNALNVASANEFLAACTEITRLAAASGLPAVRVVLMKGNGRSFMAGGDLTVLNDDPQAGANALIGPMHRGLELLAEQPAPVIVALQGPVAGAGLSLALGADLAIAADDTVFNMAYTRIGASCDMGGSWALPRVVGLRRAMEIALLCDNITAQQALDWGMVNRLVPASRLEEEARELANRLCSGPTAAYGKLRGLLRQSFERSLAGQLGAERDAFLSSAATADFAEGVSSFLQRRKPGFTGQ